ncbi:MAG: 16S rRNA (adenine(1518)-N(6)/adenine(1519)-N(6))-dimethyltransferase RsmA [Candidatus Omnitrophota bacterium]
MAKDAVRPKKYLGQNFLSDKNVQRKIIESSGFSPKDTILEIGAGRGELTRLLADKVKKTYAVEIDAALSDRLKAEFNDNQKIKIINSDILRFNLDKSIPVPSRIKVIGNIPYCLSTPIMGYLLGHLRRISVILMTVQKEFAERVAALPGSSDYGSLSCFVQYYCLPAVMFTIKKTSFWPVPKVDSCLLRLEARTRPPVKVRDEAELFKVIRAAFSKRRKTLRNSLKGIIDRGRLENFFQRCSINPDARPEELGLEDFARLLNS